MNRWLNQISLFDFIPEKAALVRTECIYTEGAPCNILNAHDVARCLGVDCRYGCCRTCRLKNECGAACNQRFSDEERTR